MPRKQNGQYAKKRWIKYAMLVALIIGGVAIYADHWNGTQLEAVNPIAPMTVHADITDAAKIEAAKNKLIDDISACETQGVKEPDAAILLDSNAQMSIGAMQFQIKTVQQYTKEFTGKDISRVEAIQIAIDHQKAHDLAYKIIWQDGAWQNWLNCGNKLNAANTVKILNSL